MKNKRKFWEIDTFRGVAILMMIIYHFIFDLNLLNLYKIEVNSGFWMIFARITAILFILLVGISLNLSYDKIHINSHGRSNFLKFFKRGIIIFLYGLIISLITWFFVGENFVKFGILHLIGISILLAYPFLKLKLTNLILGILIIIGGIFLQKLSFDFYWLFWLGFTPKGFTSIDFFPILPWFGIVLIGIFIGKLLYLNYDRKFGLKDLSDFYVIKFLGFLGRYSLFIYLIHQAILFTLLYTVKYFI